MTVRTPEVLKGYFDSKDKPTAENFADLIDSFIDPIITAIPSGDHIASGPKITLIATSVVAFGDICYIDSAGGATLVNASVIATSCALVMALGTINAGASGSFLIMGIARDDTWSWTVGGLIFITITGTTGNTLSQTPPTGTDEVIQVVGVATNATRIFFNPQLVQVEHI